MRHKEHHGSGVGFELRDIILGGQDGLVNVLGVLLAIAAATTSTKIVIIAGLAATFAESISMAAVAYTSTKAQIAHYKREMEREKSEMREVPEIERQEIREIFYKKGFRGRLLDQIVKKITSSKKLWLSTMMKEELNLNEEHENPIRSACVVGFSAIVGSLIPLIPFIFMGVHDAIIASLLISVSVLFASGIAKAKLTVGKLLQSGIEMAVIGMGAALIGYGIGILMNALLA